MTETGFYENCRLCPRQCGADRRKRVGFCGATDEIRAARAALHLWEEPVISGKSGSGTVFFSGCSMQCVYCQNAEISRPKSPGNKNACTGTQQPPGGKKAGTGTQQLPGNKEAGLDMQHVLSGKVIDTGRLAEIFFELQEKGANNINLVTGDIYLPSISVSIEQAKRQGLRIPFILNTSSYIRVETLKRMEGLIDIYLADLKYIREEDAVRYSKAPGYVAAAKDAIREMVRQQPLCEISDADESPAGKDILRKETVREELRQKADAKGQPVNRAGAERERLMKKGVIVRHLLLPGMLIQAKMIVKYLYEAYGDSIYLSLMNQYTPDTELLQQDYPEIARKVTAYEYKSLIDYAANLCITNAFMQVGETAAESFIPEFDCRGL